MFSHNEANTKTRRVFRPVCKVASPVAKSDDSDCICSNKPNNIIMIVVIAKL